MKKEKGKKSNAQLIIGTLLTGKTLRSRDISDMVLKKTGREIKVQDVASMLSRISDSKKCDLGFFIERKQVGNGFVYHMVKEALKLSEEKAYGLTLKTGKERYSIDQAQKDFPGLAKYVKGGSKPKPKLKSKSKPKAAKPAPAKAAKPAVKAAKPAVKAAKPTVKAAKPVAKPVAKPAAKPVKKQASPVKKQPVSAPVLELANDKDLEKLVVKILQEKIEELGGLTLNLKVSLKMDDED